MNKHTSLPVTAMHLKKKHAYHLNTILRTCVICDGSGFGNGAESSASGGRYTGHLCVCTPAGHVPAALPLCSATREVAALELAS